MRYLINFSKHGYIKYTSHLDMIRFFKRAFKRAEIKLEYSQGFNPHPKMTFAQPLSLGYSAENELLEIETKEDLHPDELKGRLQMQMPKGIYIKSCKYLSDRNKGVAGKITFAQYEIYFDDIDKITQEDIYNFLAQKEISVLKKQKKKKELKKIDIKPMIRNMKITISENNNLVYDKNIILTEIDCGSGSNLNPELLVNSFLTFMNMEKSIETVEIQRNFLK